MINDDLRAGFSGKRQALGYSLRDMEKLTGVSFACLARFERSEGSHAKDTIRRISDWVEENRENEKRDRGGSAWRQIISRIERIEKQLGIEEP